jgi:hypothetical protein
MNYIHICYSISLPQLILLHFILYCQGTGGVALAGLLGAVQAMGHPMEDIAKQKIVVVGAGR